MTKGRFTAIPAAVGTQLHVAAPHPHRRALAGLAELTRAGFLVGVPLEVSTDDGIPAGGITLRRTYAVPLPAGAVATWAFYNDAAHGWQAVPSTISPDRRTVTAVVHHLSLWTNLTAVKNSVSDTYTAALNGAGQAVDSARRVLSQGADKFHDWAAGAVDDVIAGASNLAESAYYQVGKIFDTRVDAPTCAGGTPYWVDQVVNIEIDRNNPLLFCSGHDPKHPEVLVLKARVNRGFAFTAHLSAHPAWAWNSTMDPSLLKAIRKVVDLPAAMELPAQELAAGTATLVGPGEEYDVGFDQDTVRAAGSDRPLLELKRPSVLVFLVSMLAHLATEQGMDSDTSWVSATITVAHCASDVSQAADVATSARAVLTCLGGASDAIGKQIARAMADAGKSVKQARSAAGLTARISIYLALVGPVFNSMNYFAQTKLPASAGQVHVFTKTFATTQRIAIDPFTAAGSLEPGYSWRGTPSSGITDVLDCTFDQPSPVAVSPGTHWCGSTADNTFACWPDPDLPYQDLVCIFDPVSKQLWRRSTTGYGSTRMPKHPQPLAIELADGSRWLYRIGGAWSPTYPGTFPTYGCVANCPTQESALVGDDRGTLDTSGPVWTARVGQMGYPASSLPPPVTMPVTRVWYITAR